MSRHARHALPGLQPSAARPDGTGATARSGKTGAAAVRAGTIGAVTYVAVLVCVGAGVYIAWHQGSQGGGRGGVIAGSALLAAAVARLVLPGKLAGLLASRRRLTDVLTLTVFGAGLLAAGLVLPRLGPLSAPGNGRPADERETRITCPKSRWQIPSSS
jgi:Protein of unknown function (DUF3017)